MQGVFIQWFTRLLHGVAALFFLIILVARYCAANADDMGSKGGASENSPSSETQESTPEDDTSSSLSDVQLSGYFKNETAYRYQVPRSITKIRNVAYLNAKYPYSSHLKFNFSGWAYYDLAYDLYDYDIIADRFTRDASQPLAYLVTLPKEKDNIGADIRELYADMLFGNFDMRLGKQFVVWGVLEGVRITDEVNPQDFRELIMPALMDYRIPQWMAKIDYYRPEASYQFIFNPDMTFHKPAPPGSEWELLQEVPGTRYPTTFDYKNSDLGFKVSTTMWDTELTFSYLYTWDPFPTIFRHVLIDQSADPIFLPTYTRISMYGATFVKQLDSSILKGELAYVTGKYFAVYDTVDVNHDGWLDNNGEFKRDHVRWGIGQDFTWQGYDISPSIVQWIILNYDPAIIEDQYDTSFNLFVRKEFPGSSITFTMLAIALINMEEEYAEPKWTFRITDNFQIASGVDLFFGRASQFGASGILDANGNVIVPDQRNQFFGNFHDNNRLFIEFKYSY
jgi:hypothetical protein